jgi:hypothetical protein
MSQDPESGWQGPEDEVRPGIIALDAQHADLVAYCRAVTGQEDDAVRTARTVLDSAQAQLTDPDQLRAWLFALARMEILAGSEPAAREVFDLVYRLGIRPDDLPVVLGIAPIEADQLLAAAEAEYGDNPDQTERQPDLAAVGSPDQMLDAQLPYLVAYCSALTGLEQHAVGTAHSVLDSARSLLTDPDRLRAWLFALARREMQADAAPGVTEVLELVHQYGIRAEDLPTVLGIAPFEADQLLAAAEEEYVSSAVSSGYREADSRDSEDWHDEARGASWESSAGWDDGADNESTEVSGARSQLVRELRGLLLKPPESAD